MLQPSTKKTGTFGSLNASSDIFKELRVQNPQWWDLLKKDKELYIEIRKDNYINVYYFGGALAKISYKKGFIAETHSKYTQGIELVLDKPYNDGSASYVQIDLSQLNNSLIKKMKENIEKFYLKEMKGENISEKFIQGKLILSNPEYIDSELQFNSDNSNDPLRIDLVKLSDGLLTFVELKGITDGRLRNDAIRNSAIPEIIAQMQKYQQFIKNNQSEIKEYYLKLLAIKRNLGLANNDATDLTVNPNPKLLIAKTYSDVSDRRKARIMAIEDLLRKHYVDFEIVEWK